MKKLSPIFLIVILALLIGAIYWRNQNQGALPPEQSNWQTYKNEKYGFEINIPGVKYADVEGTETTEPFYNKQEIQFEYVLNDSPKDAEIPNNVYVSIIKDVSPKEYANILSDNAGPYMQKRDVLKINGETAEYVEMGYASGYVNHEYFFEKDKNTIAVTIYALKDSVEYQSIINSFKLR